MSPITHPSSELFALCRYCWHHPQDQMGWGALYDKLLESNLDDLAAEAKACLERLTLTRPLTYTTNWPEGMPLGGPSLLKRLCGGNNIRKDAWKQLAALFAVEEGRG